jgi:hypothetical protein
MPPVLFAVALLSGPWDDIAGPNTSAPPLPVLRRLSEVTREVDELVRQESRAASDAGRAAAAYQMTRVYREIQRDPRLVFSDSLKDAKLRLWNRLTRIKKDIQAKMKREGRRDETLTDAEVLALADVEFVTQSLADHFALSDATLGGPATVLGQSNSGQSNSASSNPPGAFGGGAAFDYGPDLVNLIQQTIVPDFWDVHGGPGTIVYFRPLMCLVVRATSDVHHRIGGTLDALGKAR